MAAAEIVAWEQVAIMASVSAAVAEALGTIGDYAAGVAAGRIDTPYPPASSAGNPPHLRTGALRDAQMEGSWVDRDGVDVVLSVGIRSDAPADLYATFVHEGTSRMEARPWLTQPWLLGLATAMLDQVERGVTQALR